LKTTHRVAERSLIDNTEHIPMLAIASMIEATGITYRNWASIAMYAKR
jgi:hypothetical protein